MPRASSCKDGVHARKNGVYPLMLARLHKVRAPRRRARRGERLARPQRPCALTPVTAPFTHPIVSAVQPVVVLLLLLYLVLDFVAKVLRPAQRGLGSGGHPHDRGLGQLTKDDERDEREKGEGHHPVGTHLWGTHTLVEKVFAVPVCK